jgi:hypothetical protein
MILYFSLISIGDFPKEFRELSFINYLNQFMLKEKVHCKERKSLLPPNYFIEAKNIEVSTVEVHVITSSFKKCFYPFIFLIKSSD